MIDDNIAYTQKVKQESYYTVTGFLEEYFTLSGQHVATIKHDVVPLSRRVGAEGEQKITLTEDTTISRESFGKTKIFKFRKGTQLISRIDQICGKLKKK